jgi:Ca2+-binding EF-hand superfamily protein
MRQFIVMGLVAAMGLGIAGYASAADKEGKKAATPEEKFKKLDTNGDGKLSLDEFKAGAKDPAKAEAQFKKLDKNGDGFVDLEEYKAGTAKKEKK